MSINKGLIIIYGDARKDIVIAKEKTFVSDKQIEGPRISILKDKRADAQRTQING